MTSQKSGKISLKSAIKITPKAVAKVAAKPKPTTKVSSPRAAMSDASWGVAGRHGDIRYGIVKPGPRLVPRG